MYMMFKHLHMTFAVISILGFMARGLLSILDSSIMQKRWIKIAPHINDTLLLVSALVIMVQMQQYPFVHGWLTAKVVGLLVYIGLGVMTIRGKTNTVKVPAYLAAILVFAYIMSVAFSKNALGFLA